MAITPARAVRIDDDDWALVELMARLTSTNASQIVRDALSEYLSAYFKSPEGRAAKRRDARQRQRA